MVGLLAYFLGLDHFGGGLTKTIEVVAKIEMERSRVFVSFNCLVFVAVLSAPEALEGWSEAMLAAIDFSIFGHFSIKIIKVILINSTYAFICEDTKKNDQGEVRSL